MNKAARLYLALQFTGNDTGSTTATRFSSSISISGSSVRARDEAAVHGNGRRHAGPAPRETTEQILFASRMISAIPEPKQAGQRPRQDLRCVAS
jgi:hypothetical protein